MPPAPRRATSGVTMDWTLDGASHDFNRGEDLGGVLEKRGDEEGAVHHESTHGESPGSGWSGRRDRHSNALAAAHLGCRLAETFVVARPHRSARPKPGPLFRHPSRVGHGQEHQMDIRHDGPRSLENTRTPRSESCVR